MPQKQQATVGSVFVCHTFICHRLSALEPGKQSGCGAGRGALPAEETANTLYIGGRPDQSVQKLANIAVLGM